jgi:hypothetical protein
MKSINFTTQLVNFMLAFGGLIPLIICLKVNFIQINLTYRVTNNVRNC